MARKGVLREMRKLLPSVAPRKSSRAAFQSRSGETISATGSNRRAYEKLKTVSQRRSSEHVPASKSPAQSARSDKESARRSPTLQPERPISFTGRSKSFTDRAPPLKIRRSKVQAFVLKVRDSCVRLRETAQQSKLQLNDLFPGNHMMVHVTAAPSSRSKTTKHQPSLGVGRRVAVAVEPPRSCRER